MMDYVGTISKLRKEIEGLNEELLEKSKQEERFREHAKRLEEGERLLTLQANVKPLN